MYIYNCAKYDIIKQRSYFRYLEIATNLRLTDCNLTIEKVDKNIEIYRD